jgi:hypothetical protein
MNRIYEDYACPNGPDALDRMATGRGYPRYSLKPKGAPKGPPDPVLSERAKKAAATRKANAAKRKQEEDAKSHEAYKAWIAELTLRLGKKPDIFDMMEDRKRQRRQAGLEDDDDF